MKYYDSDPYKTDEPVIWFDYEVNAITLTGANNSIYTNFDEAKKAAQERISEEIEMNQIRIDELKADLSELKTMKASDVIESDNPFYN